LHVAERPDHHVCGLQVPVDHVVGVRVRDGLAHLLERRHEPSATAGGVAATF
jgi:hypothetical protein